MKYQFVLVGGDLRNVKLAERLEKDGHKVFAIGLKGFAGQFDNRFDTKAECFAKGDAVIGPVPFSADSKTLHAPLSSSPIELADVLEAIPSGKLLIAGRIPGGFQLMAEKKGIRTVDFLERDDMAILNCIPTAEGAIQIAMEELPVTIHGTKTLVFGMGKVGRVLANRLRNLGADVMAVVRKTRDIAWAETEYIKSCTYDHLPEVLSDCQLVYNTVPALVLDHSLLSCLPKDTLVVDLASRPGGVDFEGAASLGIRTIHALSLPGKVAPVSAADNIARVVYHIMEEQNGKIGGTDHA